MRDLNPRIASEDNILYEKLNETLELLLLTTKEVTTLQNRCSCNGLINTSGRKLVKICNNLNLSVANGDPPGDIIGNWTCFNNGGVSVVDYLLAESPLFKNILNFTVLSPEFDSKHAPITLTFKIPKLENEKGTSQPN